MRVRSEGASPRTEATVRELEEEIRCPLSQVVRGIEAAPTTRAFRQRLTDNLATALDGRLR